MKKFFNFLFIASLFCLCACENTNSEQNTANTTSEAAPEANEDDLFTRLSSELIASPTTTAERDKNTIINYALDSLLEVQSTNSGLYYQILEQGDGDLLKWGDRISAHYTGRTLDGKEFDSSYKRNEPLTFYIGNMVAGWNEGLQLLRPKGKAIFLIPSALAYGEKGFPLANGELLIEPNTVLRFEVEVVEKIEVKKEQ